MSQGVDVEYEIIEIFYQAPDEFALKSQIVEIVDNYRMNDDYSAYTIKNIEFYSLNTDTEFYNEWRVNEFVEGMHVSITIELGNVSGVRDYEFDMTDITYQISPTLFVSCLKTSNTKYTMLATREKKNTVDRYDFKINSITYKVPDELGLKSQIEELKAENEELRTMINDINNKLDNLVSKDTLTNSVINSLFERIDYDRNGTNYMEEALKYLYYGTITSTEFWVQFKEKEYPNAKYLIWASYDDYEVMKKNAGYAVFYDFVARTGKAILFKNMTVAAVSKIITLESYIDEDKLVIFNDKPIFDDGTEMLGKDDLFENTNSNEIKFFKVINKGEEELSQLFGALMKCGIDMKL